MVKWRGLDKINVYRVYNSKNLMAISLMFMIHETLPKKLKTK